MSHPVIALKKAARDALLADAPLAVLLGGARVYDEAPKAADPPHIVLAESRARDLSTNTGRAQEILLGLEIWSRQGGSRESLALAARCEAILDGAALALPPGFRLAGLNHSSTETRRPNRSGDYSALCRFRAYVEIL